MQITCKVTAAGPAFNLELLVGPEQTTQLIAARDSVAVQEQLFRRVCYINHNWPAKTKSIVIVNQSPFRLGRQIIPHYFVEDRDET